jgi:membrane associated rhomboid family serine protease
MTRPAAAPPPRSSAAPAARSGSPTPPLAVAALALTMAAVYAGEVVLARGPDGQAALDALLHDWGLVPRALGPDRWITLLSALFLHAGLVHAVSNAGFLVVFGPRVEAVLGSVRFLALYLGAGLAAEALHVCSAPRGFLPAVGASGAVAGVLGAWWRLGGVPGSAAPVRGRAVGAAFVALWLAAQAVAAWRAHGGSGLAAVAGWAHLGGFAAGLLAARPLASRRSRLHRPISGLKTSPHATDRQETPR